MALINIEYGSLASSETMNKNFSYLDDKISETSDAIMTTISSMLSSIATINSRLSEITGDIVDVNDELSVVFKKASETLSYAEYAYSIRCPFPHTVRIVRLF